MKLSGQTHQCSVLLPAEKLLSCGTITHRDKWLSLRS